MLLGHPQVTFLMLPRTAEHETQCRYNWQETSGIRQEGSLSLSVYMVPYISLSLFFFPLSFYKSNIGPLDPFPFRPAARNWPPVTGSGWSVPACSADWPVLAGPFWPAARTSPRHNWFQPGYHGWLILRSDGAFSRSLQSIALRRPPADAHFRYICGSHFCPRADFTAFLVSVWLSFSMLFRVTPKPRISQQVSNKSSAFATHGFPFCGQKTLENVCFHKTFSEIHVKPLI